MSAIMRSGRIPRLGRTHEPPGAIGHDGPRPSEFGYLRAHLLQDVGEQTIVDMDVNGFSHVLCTWTIKDDRHAGRIQRDLETRGSLERAAVELIGVFESYFRLI